MENGEKRISRYRVKGNTFREAGEKCANNKMKKKEKITPWN